MKHTMGSMMLLGCVVTGMGCGSSNPLEGTWDTTYTVGAFSGNGAIDLNSDGTLTGTVTGSGTSCTGSWTITGFTWTSTATTLTVTGSAVCAGSLSCGAVSVSCGSSDALHSGTCTYTLSNGNNTLTLAGCSGLINGTFARGG